ncbi:hypothetical protein HMPREF9723_02160 [Treponema denticola OTK]|uniref:Uncharacterized protein n=1 Tax=Treponema denticola OTK TaxID=999434 RepID=A0A0F6MNR7_TREDN|nr:hypothetical protein [Treponema denticola]EMB20700.1 hypothetical protein HMPREF9723_02160 [Treponema denticola OTK]
MNFLDQQEKIQEYIKKNYKIVLSELSLEDVNDYIDDYLDFDKYTKAKILFFDFGKYKFNSLSNESNEEEFEFKIYIAFRNGKAKDLKSLMLKYTAAFYEMFERSGGNFNGVADFGVIEDITFYNATEANINIKLSEISIKLKTER